MGLHVLVILARTAADELHDQVKEDEGKQRQKPNQIERGMPGSSLRSGPLPSPAADGQNTRWPGKHKCGHPCAPGEQLLMLIFIGFIDGQKSVVEDQRRV